MVSVPTWLFVTLVVFAAWAALDRLLLPSVRWLLRRRVNRVIEELNERLALKIEPFRLTKRQVLIDRLLYDAEVQAAAEAHAEANNMRRDEVMAEVGSYVREIVPAFNAYAYFRLAYWIAKNFALMLYRVRLGRARDEDLRKIPHSACVVFVMNHRSNMDYVLVCYLAASRSALSFAVGEWARVWPLQALLRATGAFFIRRGSGNELYRKVLAAYVRMATRAGVTQAMYPEGGLTQDGKLQPARLGLLAYMVGGYEPQGTDIVFVPVGINYDRVLEDRTLLALKGNERRSPPRAAGLLGGLAFGAHQLKLYVTGRWYRFGYAGVGFGKPISLHEYTAARGIDWSDLSQQRAQVQVLGDHLLDAVGEVIPVLPVSLIAVVLKHAQAPLDALDVKLAAAELMSRLEQAGAYVHVPRDDRDYALEVGLRMLLLRGIISESDGCYDVVPSERELLDFYAASIEHHLKKIPS